MHDSSTGKVQTLNVEQPVVATSNLASIANNRVIWHSSYSIIQLVAANIHLYGPMCYRCPLPNIPPAPKPPRIFCPEHILLHLTPRGPWQIRLHHRRLRVFEAGEGGVQGFQHLIHLQHGPRRGSQPGEHRFAEIGGLQADAVFPALVCGAVRCSDG